MGGGAHLKAEAPGSVIAIDREAQGPLGTSHELLSDVGTCADLTGTLIFTDGY